MLNEIEEFSAYIGTLDYRAAGKYDSTYLGRFTYDMLLKLINCKLYKFLIMKISVAFK